MTYSNSTSPKEGVIMGLYSNVWLRLRYSGNKRVNMKESLAFAKTCPDIKFHAYWYYSY